MKFLGSCIGLLAGCALLSPGEARAAGDAGVALHAAKASSRSADAILRDYAKAIGGAAGFARHHSLYTKRRVQVPGMGVGGTEERWTTAAGKFLSITTLPGVGTVKQGSDGHLFWSEDPINGLRHLEGAEGDQARIDATWNAELELKKIYKTVVVVPTPTGAPADTTLECLRMAPPRAQPIVTCFDAASHLRVYQQGQQATPQGEVPYSARLSDWREVEGVKFPFREQMSAGPMSVDSTVETVEFDKKLTTELFRTPTAPKSDDATEEKMTGGPGKKPAAAKKAPAAQTEPPEPARK